MTSYVEFDIRNGTGDTELSNVYWFISVVPFIKD